MNASANRDDAGTGTAPRARTSIWSAIALAVLLMVVIPCGVIHHGDGQARYAQAKAIALYGRMDIPETFVAENPEASLIKRTPEGRYYPVHGPGMPLIWSPFVWMASVGERILGIPTDALAGFLISLINPALVFITWLMLRRRARLLADERAAKLSASLYLCGTLALVYANTSFSEVICGMAILYCVSSAALLEDRRQHVAAAIAGGLLCLVRYELLLFAAMVPVVLAMRRLRKPLFSAVIASAAGPLTAAGLNWVQRGSPLRAGPGTLSDQFGAPWQGLQGYVLDVDKALWLYYPVLWLLVPALLEAYRNVRLRPLTAAVIGLWLVYLPLYAASVFEGRPNWGGGLCYGTRHFVVLMPVTVLVLVPLVAKLRTTATLAARTWLYGPAIVGLLVQLPGISVKSEQAEILSAVTGEAIVVTQAKVLWIKLKRGPAAPEVYHRSDLTPLQSGQQDTVVDFRARRTFRWLHHWWAIALASKLQGYPLLRAQSEVTRMATCTPTMRYDWTAWDPSHPSAEGRETSRANGPGHSNEAAHPESATPPPDLHFVVARTDACPGCRCRGTSPGPHHHNC